MKMFLTGVILALVLSQPAFAQQQAKVKHQPSPAKMVERMDKVVDLNENQEKQVLAIYEEFFKKMKEVRGSGDVDREKLRENRQELQKKINEVLNPDQQNKWKEFRTKQAEERKARTQRHRMGR